MCYEGKLIKNPQILADTFNNYFSRVLDESVTNIFKQNNNQINQHSYLYYLVHKPHQPFLPINLKPVTGKEIHEMNKSFKWKNSCGYDEVPSRIVKVIMPFISSPLICICNRILSTGNFPTHLTFSQNFQVFETGSKVKISAYR
jgi:hypothetical protein